MLLVAHRRGRIAREAARTGVLSLAEAESLTFYHATYLELALRRGVPLASRDEALCGAAHGRGG